MPLDTVLAGTKGGPSAVTVAMYQQWEKEADRGWSKKPDFIHRRLKERFIDPISLAPAYARHGFATMAISCLLIETLEAFYKGWTSTRNHSADSFKSFFGHQTRFKDFAHPDLAQDFFDHVRCGILHQGETRNRWTIVRSGRCLDQKRINATRFHKRLALAVRDYSDELRDPTRRDLRTRFDNKMRFIIVQAP